MSIGYSSTRLTSPPLAQPRTAFRLAGLRRQPSVITVSSTPPTITEGAAQTLTGGQTLIPDSTTQSTAGFPLATQFLAPLAGPLARMDVASTSYVVLAPPPGSTIEQRFGVGMVLDGQSIEFTLRQDTTPGTGAVYWAKVNGQWLTAAPVALTGAAAGNQRFLRFDFGAVGQYNIELWFFQVRLGKIFIATADSLYPLPRGGAVRVGFLGDSISGDASGPTHAFENWCNIAARMLGWDEVFLDGIGGTGYIEKGGTSLTDSRTVMPLAAGWRVDRMIAAKPDVVVLAMGINDTVSHGSGFTDVTLADACLRTWARLRAGLPDAAIIVVNAFDSAIGDGGTVIAQINQAQSVISRTAAAHPELVDVFVETRSTNFNGLWVGGARTSANNTRMYASGPGSPHPGPDGHELYGRFVAGAISTALHAA